MNGLDNSKFNTQNLKFLRVALVIDYFYWYGGAQKVEEAILKVFPNADVYAGFRHPKYKGWLPKNVHYTVVQKLPFKRLFAPIYELLLPFAFERLDFSKYDLVISSTQCFAKGVIVPPGVKHISYIHTPPRFLWGLESSRQSKVFFLIKTFLLIINHFLRIWDFHSAQRPHGLLTNAEEVQKRIAKFYKRDSIIVHPPVDTLQVNEGRKMSPSFTHLDSGSVRTREEKDSRDKNLFVSVGRLVSYKKVDIAVEAFKKMPEYKLIIIGSGDEEGKLKRLARGCENISFLGFVDGNVKFDWIKKAKAVIHLPFEDFGIVPVEAMVVGTPVIGLNAGGTRETVINEVTGILLNEISVENVIDAVKQIAKMEISAERCKNRAEEFGFENFKKQLLKIVENT